MTKGNFSFFILIVSVLQLIKINKKNKWFYDKWS